MKQFTTKTRLARAAMTLLVALLTTATAWAQEPIPYTEGFEDMSSADDLTDAGWISYQTHSGSFLAIETTATNVHSGSKALNIDSWDAGSSSDYVVVGLPLVDAAINTLQITFSYKVSTGNVYVGYLTDANDASTFVSLESYTASSNYTTVTKELNEAPATAARIAIKYLNWYRCYIDDIEVKLPPTCMKPTLGAARIISEEGASFQWTENGSATDWVLEYSTDQDFTNATSVNRSGIPNYAITGLTAGTLYYVHVKSDCGGGDTSDWSNVVSFTTLCEPIDAVGYSENFDSYTGINSGSTNNLPDCWNYINTCSHSYYSGYPNIYSGDAASSPNCLKFYSYYSSYSNYDPQPQYAALPPMNGLAGMQVTLKARGYNTSSTFKIGTMGDPTDASTFTLIAEQDGLTTSYPEVPFEYLIPAICTDSYLAIMIDAATSNRTANGVYIDDIEIREAPTCLRPNGLAVTETTATSATLSWTNGAEGQTAWQICINGDEEHLIDANSNPFTIGNLTAATSYTAKVRACCSETEQSEWSKMLSFNTQCEANTIYPWTENFDSYTTDTGVLPDCWSRINNTTNSSYSSYPYLVDYSAHSGSNCLKLYSFASYSNGSTTYDPQPQYAILPPMENLTGKQIMLQAKGYNTTSTFKIGTMSNPLDASTFTMIAEQTLTTSYPEDPFEYLVPADCTDSYVAIMIDAATPSRTTNGVYIDDIVIREAPTCLKPTDLAVTATTTSSATLSWTNGAEGQDAWQICINGDEEHLIDANSNPFTIDNLTVATLYTAKVRAYCSADDQSDWSKEINFTTECETITITESNTYIQGFEDYTGVVYNANNGVVPVCWDSYSTGSVAPHIIGSGSYHYVHDGNNALTFYGSGYCYAALPEFTNALSQLQISFWMWTESSSNGELTLGYITAEDENFNTFTAIETYGRNNGSMVQRLTYLNEVPAAATQLVFRWFYSTQYSCCIDDVEVSLIPSCVSPTGLTASDVTSTSATLSWAEHGSATAWVLQYGTDETFTAGTYTETTVSTNPTTSLTGLTSESIYYARVKPACDTEGSNWSNVVEFVPTNFVDYTYNEGATSYNSYYPFSGSFTQNATNQSQFVIPAEELAEIAGGTIRSITYYTTNTTTTTDWGGVIFDVYMAEVENSTFTDATFIDWETLNNVYTGTISLSNGMMTIAFDRNYTYNGGNLLIGFKTNTVGTTTQSVNWTATYGSNKYHVVYQYGSNSASRTYYFPKITFSYLPTPYKYPVIDEANCTYTTTSAHIAWTVTGATPTGYQYQFKTISGEWPANWSSTTDAYADLSSLTHSTYYDFRVKALYDGRHESIVVNYRFATECDVITTFPVTYGFETTEGFPANASTPTTNLLGDCWRNEATVQTGSNATRVWGTSTNYHHDGSQALILPDKGSSSSTETDCAKTMLVFPAMEFTAPSGYIVSFWINRMGTKDNPEGFKMYISDCDYIGPNAVELGHYSRNYGQPYPVAESASGWYQYQTAPIMMTGTVYMIFEGQSYYGNPTYVDDITIDVAPTCWQPQNLAANNVTNEAATLTWERHPYGDETAWVLQYGEDNNFETGSYTELTDGFTVATVGDVTTVTANLTNLSAEHTYYARVKPACDTEGNLWSEVVSFTTLSNCAAPDGLNVTELTDNSAKLNWSGVQESFNVRYRKLVVSEEIATTEDFSEQTAVGYNSSEGELPTGWYSYTTGSYAPRVSNASKYSYISALTDNYLLMTTTGTGQSAYAIMPQYSNITAVSFNYAFESTSSCGNLEVGYVTDNTGYSTFTRVGEPIAPATGSNSYSLSSSDIATINSNNGYIAFKYNSNSSYYSAAIDDVVVTTQSFTPGAWNTDNTNVTSGLTINSLETNTKYEWQVQGISSECKGGGTEWSASAYFTTLANIDLVNDATNNASTINSNDGVYANVTLTGRELYKDGYWNTLYLPFSVTLAGSPLAGAEARELSSANISGTTLNLNFSEPVDELTAGTPYIIKWSSGATLTETDLVFDGVIVYDTDKSFDNGENGDARVRFIGTYDQKTIATEDRSILFLGADNKLYYPDGTNGGVTIGACRAYFKIGEDGGAGARLLTGFNLNFGDETNAVFDLNNKEERRNNSWYSLDGVKLDGEPTKKGLYIYGGRKVVIK